MHVFILGPRIAETTLASSQGGHFVVDVYIVIANDITINEALEYGLLSKIEKLITMKQEKHKIPTAPQMWIGLMVISDG